MFVAYSEGVKARIGYGEDAHALAEGRPLVLGGVRIDSPRGALAHSDGDALLHALTDALLSAFALGDIGQHFPPSDPAFAGADSAALLCRVVTLVQQRVTDFRIGHVAAVVTLDTPKLGVHREAIQGGVAALLGLKPPQVGLTFKTSEGLAPNHVQARVALLAYGVPLP